MCKKWHFEMKLEELVQSFKEMIPHLQRYTPKKSPCDDRGGEEGMKYGSLQRRKSRNNRCHTNTNKKKTNVIGLLLCLIKNMLVD